MNDQKTIMMAMSPALAMVIDMMRIRYDKMKTAIYIEGIFSVAKKLMYDITGDNTDIPIRELLDEFDLSGTDQNGIYLITTDLVKEYLMILVTHNIVNENIYVMDIIGDRFVMNTYSFFIDVNNNNVDEII